VGSLSGGETVTLNTAGNALVSTLVAGGAVAVNVTGTATGTNVGNSLTLGSMSAAGQAVSLNVAGAVLDGAESAATNITAAGLSITAASVGTADNALDTSVDTLVLNLGAGGAFILESNGLVVLGQGIRSEGSVSLISRTGDIQLDANVRLQDDSGLVLQALTGAITQTDNSTIGTDAGDVSIQGQTGASVARVSSGSGRIDVLAVDGVFAVPAGSVGVSYGDQPVRIQGAGVDIASVLSGSGTIAFTVPTQKTDLASLSVETPQTVLSVNDLNQMVNSLPIVIGDTRGLGFDAQAPIEGRDEGLFIDSSELNLLAPGFERIVIGSQDPRQIIWLGAPKVDGVNQSLVFRDPLVLVASGLARDLDGDKLVAGGVRISGNIEGKGLVILGSGSTTELNAAQLRQAGDVLISDSLIVHSDSQIEVTTLAGILDIRGSILVKSGATLSLLASDIRLNTFDATGGQVMLEAGATLVLGTQRLTVDSDLLIDGGGLGHLVLKGWAQAGEVQDFALSAQELQSLTAQMVDGSFTGIALGQSGTDTTVMSPSIWSEGAASVSLRGDTVHLGAVGLNADWQIGSHAQFNALDGDLQLNANLLSSNGAFMVLSALAGELRMASDVRIVTEGGLIALNAAHGIEVAQIDASGSAAGGALRGAVALDSAQGQIVLAGTSNGVLGVRAQSLSLYGYGQAMGTVAADDRVLRAETERLQTSAPSGLISRGMNAEGTYYRLSDRGATYAQVQVLGDAPERVMLPRTEVAGQAVQSVAMTALGASVSSGFTHQVQSMASAANPRALSQDVSMQTQAYLSSYVRPMLAALTGLQAQEKNWISLDSYNTFDDADLADDLALSDLAYGFTGPEASFVMGLPAVQTNSAGNSVSSSMLFDFVTE
jgi:hypothetical protein